MPSTEPHSDRGRKHLEIGEYDELSPSLRWTGPVALSSSNSRRGEADDQAWGQAKQGGASRISQNLRLSPCHDPRFSALIAAAACSQIVDVSHVKNRRL